MTSSWRGERGDLNLSCSAKGEERRKQHEEKYIDVRSPSGGGGKPLFSGEKKEEEDTKSLSAEEGESAFDLFL